MGIFGLIAAFSVTAWYLVFALVSLGLLGRVNIVVFETASFFLSFLFMCSGVMCEVHEFGFQAVSDFCMDPHQVFYNNTDFSKSDMAYFLNCPQYQSSQANANPYSSVASTPKPSVLCSLTC